MLVTNDAFLHRFEVTITSLDVRFKPSKPISILWKKDDKQAETQKSLNFFPGNVTFKDNVLALNLRLIKDNSNVYEECSTNFVVLEHDVTIRRELATCRLTVTDIFLQPKSSYTLSMTKDEVIKGYLNFSLTQKFVMKVSQFKFNKQIQSPQHSEVSGGYRPVQVQRPAFCRRASISYGEVNTNYKDEAESLFIQNKRLKTDQEKLATRTKAALAKNQRAQKMILWEHKQIKDFYETKLRVCKQVYQGTIEKIVFATNTDYEEYRRRMDQLESQARVSEEKYEHSLRELKQLRDDIVGVNEESDRLMEEQRNYLEIQKTQYANKSSELIRTYGSRIEELETALSDSTSQHQRLITQRDAQIRNLTHLYQQTTKQLGQLAVLKDQIWSTSNLLSQEQQAHQASVSAITQINHLLDDSSVPFSELSTITAQGKIKYLVTKYKEQKDKLASSADEQAKQMGIQTSLLRTRLSEEIEVLRAQLQERDVMINDFKLRDQVGQKSMSNIENLLAFQKQSQQLFATRLEGQIGQSQSLRRQLRAKQLQLLENNRQIQQLTSHNINLESALKILQAQTENYQRENLHLEETVRSLDLIVAQKHHKTGSDPQLVDQLQDQIRDKDNTIMELEGKRAKLLTTLHQYRYSEQDLEYVISVILAEEQPGEDIAQLDHLEQSELQEPNQAVSKSRSCQSQSLSNQQMFTTIKLCQGWVSTMDNLYSRLLSLTGKTGLHKSQSLGQDFPQGHRATPNARSRKQDGQQLESLCQDFLSFKGRYGSLMGQLQGAKQDTFLQNQRLKEQITNVNKEVGKLLESKKSRANHIRQADDKDHLHLSQISALNSKIQAMETQVAQKTRQAEELNQQNQTLQEQQFSQALNHQRAHQRQLNQASDMNQQLQESYRNIERLNRVVHSLNEQVQTITNCSEDHSRDNRLLRSQCSSLEDSNKALKSRVCELEEQHLRLKEKFKSREDALQAQVSQARTSLSKCMVQLTLSKESADNNTHNSSKQFQAMRFTLLERQQEIRLQCRSIEDFRIQEVETDRKVRQLQSRLRETCELMQDNVRESNSKQAVIQRQAASSRQLRRSLEQQIKQAKDRCQLETQRSQAMQGERRSWQEKADETRRLLEACQAQLKLRKDNVQEVQLELRHFKVTWEKLGSQKSQTEMNLKLEIQQNQRLRNTLSASSASLQALEKRLNESANELKQSAYKVTSLGQSQVRSKELMSEQLVLHAQRQKELHNQIGQRDLYIGELKRSLLLKDESMQKQTEQLQQLHKSDCLSLQQQIESLVQKQKEFLRQTGVQAIQAKQDQSRAKADLAQIKKLRFATVDYQVQIDNQYRQSCVASNTIYTLQQRQNQQTLLIRDLHRQLENSSLKEIGQAKELQMQIAKKEQTLVLVDSQKASSREKERIIELLNAQISELKERVYDEKEKVRAMAARCQSKLEESQTEFVNLQAQFGKFREDHQYSNKEFTGVVKQRDALRAEQKRCVQQMDQMEKSHSQAVAKLQQAHLKREQYKNSVIDAEVSQMSLQTGALKTQVETLAKGNNQSQTQRSILQQKLKRVSDNLSQKLSQLEARQELIDTMSRDFRAAQQALQKQKSQIQGVLALQTLKNQHLEVQVAELSRSTLLCKELQVRNSELEIQLQRSEEASFKAQHSWMEKEDSMTRRMGQFKHNHQKKITLLDSQILGKQNEIDHYITTNSEKEQLVRRLQLQIQFLEQHLGSTRTPQLQRQVKRMEIAPTSSRY